MEYRKDIQGLRAIAVLFVFIFHLNPKWLPGGFVGVDIFFVISGFLISSIILSKLKNNTFSFFNFYKSRIKRIAPAYYFLLIILTIAGIFVFVSSDIYAFRKSLFWSTIFNSNYYFSTLDTYFGAENSENPFLHTWTLAIEMQFYLFLPLLLVFIKRKWLLPFISILTIALFVYGSFNIFNGNKNIMYFSLLARTPEFLIGVLCSLMSHKFRLSRYVSLSLSVLGISLLLYSAFFINDTSYFPGILAIIPCFGSAFLILNSENQISTFLSNKVLYFIGNLSYSLYLWHWPIMAFFRYYYNTHEFTWIQCIVIILMTFSFSLFSYYFIETYIRKKEGFNFWSTLALFIGINIFTIFIIIPITKKITNIPITYTTPVFGMNSHGFTFKNIEIFGDTLDVNNKILLLGDSHALCMKPYLDYMGTKFHFGFKTITNDRYPTIPNLPKEDFTEERYYKLYCNLMRYANKEISESDVIILQYKFEGDKLMAPIKELIENLRSNQKFILISDFPSIDKHPIRVNRGIVKNKLRNNNYKIQYAYPPTRIIDFMKSRSNCYYLDLSHSKAFNDIPFYNDTVIYYDKGHLNLYGSKIYAKETEKEFMKLFRKILE